MRIIAGQARGRTLVAPAGRDTRPTQDRIRESLFSIVQARIPDARVLDLFAGSGALGLEALSRGAQSAVLVDHAAAACKAIARNVETLGMGARARLLSMDWRKAVRVLQEEGARFDLFFLDPPYRMEGAGNVAGALRGLAAPGALYVLEYDKGLPPRVELPLACVDERKYGNTMIGFYTEEERS